MDFIFTSQRTLKNEYTVIKDRPKLLTEQVKLCTALPSEKRT